MRVLDLFSGIGGFSLGLERAGMETVAFCEIDPFCQKVLAKHWPEVPIFEDVRTLEYDGPVDLICGGYPCQPFSTAGKRQGQEDDRHLWPAMFGLIQKHRPAWVIGENVAGHISMGLDDVLSDLEGEGYQTGAFVIPACAVAAFHKRDRVWVVANDDSRRQSRARTGAKEQNSTVGSPNVAYPKRHGCKQMESSVTSGAQSKGATGEIKYSGIAGGRARWLPEPSVGRVADGVSRRVDRLRSLGNAVVPQIPEMIGRAIMEAQA